VNLSQVPAFYLQGAKRLTTEVGSQEGELPSVTAIVACSPRGQGQAEPRPSVKGKFLFLGDEKLPLKGVTYGPFGGDDEGAAELDPELVERDFGEMAANGLNAVRLYTVPPRWMLDTAARHGLPVVVVVVNNGGWGDVRHEQRAFYGEEADLGAVLSGMRYDWLAEAVGGHGERVESPEELLPALERAVDSETVAVVDAVTDPDVMSDLMKNLGGMDVM